ncbi:MAG: aminodeoxychorismate/anthranilate synthase component II [Ignavibacteria bacterium]|nr:aminodeoxychorismate/anthranilate synthase component II [Ignavibacteria bacterium]
MILLIDNYDSFTYNLVQYIETAGQHVHVARNNEITPDEASDLQPDGIVISPGPGRPEEAGLSNEIIRRFSGNLPLLGVCLGHQCIVEAFGGTIEHAWRVMHGKRSLVVHNGKELFTSIPSPLQVVRYHSLIAERATLPDELRIVAETPEGEIMGIKHRTHDTWGIQFHPESILTDDGFRMVENFCAIVSNRKVRKRKTIQRKVTS